MIRYALNYCLVKINKRFQDSHGNIKIDPSWHPEEHATMEGVVYSAPLVVENNLARRTVMEVKDGDRVFFSYTVVFGYDMQPDGQTPVYKNLVLHNGEEYWKVDVGDMFFRWTAKGGIEMITEHVLMMFHKEPFEKKIIYGNLLQVQDKGNSTEQSLLQGVSQRKNEGVEKNTQTDGGGQNEGQRKELREYIPAQGEDNEKELSRVRQPEIGNASRGLLETDRSNLAMSGLPHEEAQSGGIVVRNRKLENIGIVIAIPQNINLSVHVGDMVCFEPRFVQKYNILGQEHMIIQTHRLLAKA